MSIDNRVEELIASIRSHEKELEELLGAREAEILERFEQARGRFELAVEETHRRLRTGLFAWLRASEPKNVVTAPVIYAMIIPFALLDMSVSIYQALCFPLYGISKVARADYIVIDRHRLGYLNAFEKINCVYCGYVVGLVNYIREIVARTEQYWCPIKHAKRLNGAHGGIRRYAAYGDAQAYPVVVREMREFVTKE